MIHTVLDELVVGWVEGTGFNPGPGLTILSSLNKLG
jgi:hypothetical protein